MTALATTLPAHSNDGYVAAAYIVFFAIVLIYVAIMTVRLGRVERKVEDLRRDAPSHARESPSGEDPTRQGITRPHPEGTRQEHETV